MRTRIILLLTALTFGSGALYAQRDSLFWNSDMKQIATPSSTPDWITILPEVSIDPLTFFPTHKIAMGQGVNDEMRLFKEEKDQIGFTHIKFQQFHKGYRILNAEFVLHVQNDELISGNGKIAKGLELDPKIGIKKDKALQAALNYMPALQYAWEIPQLENDYKGILHDPNATYRPIGELVWISIDENDQQNRTTNLLLAYMFDIYSASLEGKRIFIDASSGAVLKSIPLVANCTGASVATNFYGVQGFSTRLIPGSNPAAYNLWNDCQTAFVHTRLWNSNIGMSGEYISGANNSWNGASSAATSHWGVEKAYFYFLNIHGRLGWNNADAGVNIYEDALFCSDPPGCTIFNNSNNASFSSGTMLVGNSGNASNIDDWNSLDIIAHEFAHGVTQSSANLIYSKESGALNESFSDIFGATCHASLFGLSANTWLIGFDRKNPSNVSLSLYIRNMSNPNDKGDPDTYLGTNWVSTTTPTDVGGDNWGVHTNSGVQNYMYYLLTSGGIGTNDSGNAFSLIGIGMVAARDIAYRALTVYLSAASTYADARNAWVRSATDLYGECSFQAIETGKAWDAVGLGPPLINQATPVCGVLGTTIYSLTDPNTFALSPNCTLTIVPSSLVQFGSRKVILNPGFKAQNGSHFRAYVSDCRFASL